MLQAEIWKCHCRGQISAHIIQAVHRSLSSSSDRTFLPWQDIKNCGNGDIENLMRVIIACLDSPERHFAEVVRNSIIGLGTDEDMLTRAIVMRAEIDMMKVRDEYFNMYKSNMDNAVIGDTSGDYRRFLLTLLGAKT